VLALSRTFNEMCNAKSLMIETDVEGGKNPAVTPESHFQTSRLTIFTMLESVVLITW